MRLTVPLVWFCPVTLCLHGLIFFIHSAFAHLGWVWLIYYFSFYNTCIVGGSSLRPLPARYKVPFCSHSQQDLLFLV